MESNSVLVADGNTTSAVSPTRRRARPKYVCVVCVFFPFILDIKFVGRTSRGHTGGWSHRIFHPPSFCGACLNFSREKDSAIPFPRRPWWSRFLCTNDLIVLHPLGIYIFSFFSFLVRKIPFAGIELTSQRVRGLRGTSELPGRPAHGVRNHRQNVYASPEVCIFWLDCLISTTTVVGTYWKHGLGRFHDGQKYVIRNKKWEAKFRAFRQAWSSSSGAALKSSSFFWNHVPRSMPYIGFDSSSSAPLPATKSPFLPMTNQNQTSPAPHPQNQPPDSGSVHRSQRQHLWLSLHRSHRVRFCISSVFSLSPKERSGAIDLSRRIKIFVIAAIWKSWAKILPREHISSHLKILGKFCTRFCSHKEWNKILVEKSWVRSRFLYKILSP